MVRVPTYDDLHTSLNTTPDVRAANVDSAEAETQGARQLQGFGAAVEHLGDTGSKIAIDMQDTVNQTRVADAMNQARAHAQALAYDPQNGYLNQKGQAALQRPSGLALPEEYTQKLQTGISDINQTLGNEAQRRMFSLQAGQLVTSFQGDAERHMLGEFQNYHASVADGALKLSTQDAEANWSNPQKIDQAINGVEDPVTGKRYGGIKQSIYQKAIITGASANEAEAAMNAAASSVHHKVIESALENNNIPYAMSYFNKYKSDMVADDVLAVQGKVNHQMDAHTALGAVQDATNHFASQFAPTDLDRLTSVVLANESGGQRYGADGKLLESPKGAKGEMQVMDDTNLNPGYGVIPAKDNSPGERARVGRDYLAAMVKEYGDAGQALAAYNAGPGAVDNAKAKAEKEGNPNAWLTHLPAETQKYVADGLKRYNAGQGTANIPTEMEFVNRAVSLLGDNPRIEAVTMAREQAEKQYKTIITSRKEQGDQALAAAQQELIANGGDFTALKPQTVANLSRFDAGKYDDALKFAKAIHKGENVTDAATYAQYMTHPEEAAKLSDAEWTQLGTTKLSSTDFNRLTKLRSDYINGAPDASSQSLNVKALNPAVDRRLLDIGINPKPRADDLSSNTRVANIRKFISDSIYDQQTQLGRKMTPEEISQHVDGLFAKSVDMHSMIWGDSKAKMMGMTVDDIPAEQRDYITNVFKQRGNAAPTDGDILRFYWGAKIKNAN